MCLIYMQTWAIIPVKRLSEAKSGFANVFTSEQRREFVICMLKDVLNALRGVPNVLVVSPDKKILNLVAELGAAGLKEPGLELNEALKLGVQQAIDGDASEVLILPADLPLLKAADVERIVSMASSSRDVVIAPSKANGTNAILLRPPDVINLKFGGESFPRHLEEALRAGVRPHIYRSKTVATDIDEPTDLLSVETLGLGTRTHDFLCSLKQG